jgi:hypothetical protein
MSDDAIDSLAVAPKLAVEACRSERRPVCDNAHFLARYKVETVSVARCHLELWSDVVVMSAQAAAANFFSGLPRVG